MVVKFISNYDLYLNLYLNKSYLYMILPIKIIDLESFIINLATFSISFMMLLILLLIGVYRTSFINDL